MRCCAHRLRNNLPRLTRTLCNSISFKSKIVAPSQGGGFQGLYCLGGRRSQSFVQPADGQNDSKRSSLMRNRTGINLLPCWQLWQRYWPWHWDASAIASRRTTTSSPSSLKAQLLAGQAVNSRLPKAATDIDVTAILHGPDNFDPRRRGCRATKGHRSFKPAGILISVADAAMMTPAINTAIAAKYPRSSPSTPTPPATIA